MPTQKKTLCYLNTFHFCQKSFSIPSVSDAEEVLKIALNLSKPEDFMKTRALKVLDGDANLEVAN